MKYIQSEEIVSIVKDVLYCHTPSLELKKFKYFEEKKNNFGDAQMMLVPKNDSIYFTCEVTEMSRSNKSS